MRVWTGRYLGNQRKWNWTHVNLGKSAVAPPLPFMRTFPYPVGGILCLCNWRPYDHWPFPAVYCEKFKGTTTLNGLYRGHPNTQPPGFYQLKFYCICFLKYLSIWAVYLFCLHIYCPQSQLPSHVLPHYKGDSARKQDCSHQKISSPPSCSPQWYTRALWCPSESRGLGSCCPGHCRIWVFSVVYFSLGFFKCLIRLQKSVIHLYHKCRQSIKLVNRCQPYHDAAQCPWLASLEFTNQINILRLWFQGVTCTITFRSTGCFLRRRCGFMPQKSSWGWNTCTIGLSFTETWR